MDSWIVPAWSLKYKELFRIGLVDHPRVEPSKQGVVPDWTCGLSLRGALKTRRCSGLDSWTIHAWSLKNGEVFRIGLDFMVSVLLSASVERVGVSRMRDFFH